MLQKDVRMLKSAYFVHIIVLFGLAVTAVHSQDEFLCYGCTYTNNPSRVGYECVTSPENYTQGPNQVPCPDGNCFTETTTSTFTGEVELLRRGCGFVIEGCEGDQYEQVCSSVCTSHLCNNENKAPLTTTLSSAGGSTTKDPNAFIYCWNCEYDVSIDGGNDVCVTNPENVEDLPDKPNVARCSAGSVCFIFRTHDRESLRVRLMSRSCDDMEQGEDTCTVHPEGETCVTTCTTDYCNDGDGLVGGAVSHRVDIYIVSMICTIGLIVTQKGSG